jgi:flagellar motor switch protein FliM
MSDPSLSQDEVDTLLAGVDDESATNPTVAPDSENSGSDSSDVQPYDLARQDRILRGNMPTLETVNEKFARGFRQRVFNLTDQLPELTVGEVSVEKYGDYLAGQVVPSNLNVIQIKPLRGKGLVIFEPQLICAIVDGLFGGTGQLQAQFSGREFSATEHRIILNLMGAFVDAYSDAWSRIYPIELEYVRSEMQPQFANIATPTEMVITTRFGIEMCGVAGAAHLCIPYGTFEPIREILYANVNTDQLEQDGSWLNKLSNQLESANLELTAQLAKTRISFGDLLNLQAGDFIELDLQDELEAEVDGVPFLKCRYGTNDNRYAIKVTEFLTGPNDLINGEKHG